MLAARNGHEKCMTVALEAGADVNKQDYRGFTAMILAAVKSNIECLKVLTRAGADVNKQDNNRETAIIWAAKMDKIRCLEELIQAGADVNSESQLGYTAVMLAARGGHVRCVDVLIKAGANVNIYNKHCGTALIQAARFGYFECVKRLLRSGAKINYFIWTNMYDGLNALELALMYGRYQSEEDIVLLYAAGETIDGTKVRVPDYLKELIKGRQGLNLQHQCRQTIQKLLIELDPHKNLFNRVPRLGLPSRLQKYLLYYVSLDSTSDYHWMMTIDRPHIISNKTGPSGDGM